MSQSAGRARVVPGAEQPASALVLRDSVRPEDVAAVREIVASTGYFRPSEIEVAVELVQERLARGVSSGYFFIFAERHGRTVAYTCYGPIACTVGSFDLYWIAVHEAHRRHGVGGLLMRATEERIVQAGGRRVYIETSGREQYAPTRRFYESCGYVPEATLADFYGPGDPKVVYSKAVVPSRGYG